MDNKGTTIVEVIVSLVLISIVLVFIFNLLTMLKKEDYLSTSSTEDTLKRTEIIHIVENDFIYKGLTKVEIENCSNNFCAIFTFDDNSSKTLKVSKKDVTYVDEIWNINGEYDLKNIKYCIINNNNGYYMFKLVIPESHDAKSYRKLSLDLMYLSDKIVNLSSSVIAIDGYQIGGTC